MLLPGTPAPALTLPDQDGRPFDLAAAWEARNVVLFFYPKANTTVCTREACAFRDAFADLEALDTRVIGISRDGIGTQRAFASRWKLPFTLLCDVDGRAHKAFEVRGFLGLLPARITYVIARGGTIRAAHDALLQSDGHVQAALAALAAQGSA
jgi:peroxiredoxin Q/BCP